MIALLIANFILLHHVKAQAPWYGQIAYPHTAMVLTSAIRTSSNVGYLMAGARPLTTNPTQANFVIDKVDDGGLFSTATDFASGYHIIDCASQQQTYCAGVSVIETGNYVAGQTYALAVATEDVLVFATLDAFGVPIQQMSWSFPAFSFNIQSPHITESQVNPGNYYICGSVSQTAYIIKVDFNGSILWSFWYDPAGTGGTLHPHALMESPYSTDELIVAGRIDVPGSTTAADGFFMRISAINGGFLSCKYYNFLSWDSDEWFTSIAKASSPTGSDGFFLGGRAFGPVIAPTTPPSPRPTNVLYVPWVPLSSNL